MHISSNLGLEDSVLCKESLAILVGADENTEIDMELGQHCKTLWEDPGIQQVWDRRAEYQIVESVKFYFDKLDEIMKPGYVATQQDMLYTRVRTSGIVTERLALFLFQFCIYPSNHNIYRDFIFFYQSRNAFYFKQKNSLMFQFKFGIKHF